jgi:L-arabinonolactonase
VSGRAVTELAAICVLPARAMLGESPVWSEREGRLYWIDIDGRLVHRSDPVSGLEETRTAPGRPGSLALTADEGRILVAIEERIAFLDWADDRWEDWVALEPAGSGNRLNDGRTDPAGRFWVGSMFDPTSAEKATGMLHRVEVDGSSTVTRDGIGVSNGLAFSPDGRTMYWADTKRDTVWAYDYDVDAGEATGERVFLDFSDLPGRPDGACTDADGCYWIACVYGSAVLRVTPDGVLDGRVNLPVPKPTMPTFGGPDLSTLYITTIGGGGSHAVDPAYPEAGGVFAVETGVRGFPQPAFAGGPQARGA